MHTMTLSGGTMLTLTGGTTWGPADVLTLTASAAFFSATDVGTVLPVTDTSGNTYSFVIVAFGNANVVTGNVTATVPAPMRGVAVPLWNDEQQLVLTSSGGTFVSGDVGNFASTSMIRPAQSYAARY